MNNAAADNANLHVYYITHRDNLPSILQHGILSHENAEKLSDARRIHDDNIVSRRRDIPAPDGSSLWSFANFYFNARNPMLYRVHACENAPVAVIRIKKQILNIAKYVAVGNAASSISQIVPLAQGLKTIRTKAFQETLHAGSWGQHEGKRLIMAELLVPGRVPPEYIDTIYVPDAAAAQAVKPVTGGAQISVVPEPNMFFQPNQTRPVAGTQIKLIEGDMFFSRLQTLTISVNTVGVMGGGLAARAKLNFPHIYVKFQELCRSKQLTTKRPFLYKEQYSYDEHMADAPETLTHKPNDEKWFLLFATKEHWRNPSRLDYIRDGFKWLLDNAAESGVQSLAMPALGCGLGGLPWHAVGPVMCRNLHRLNIPCEIYLPRENDVRISDEQLAAEFLLNE